MRTERSRITSNHTGAALSRTRLERMHDVMAEYVERGDVPGVVTLVSRRGEVHVNAIGTLSAGGSEPMRRDTLFRISSMTKPVVAAAAMILVEECRLRLDDPVDDLLPELANPAVLRQIDSPLDDTVPADRPSSLRDLLTFRMGLGLILAPPDTYPIQTALNDPELGQGPPSPASFVAPDEWLRRLGALPLLHQPGERWLYGTGSDVLGVLIARAAGQPLETFLRERIFEPLGMQNTGFSVSEDKIHRLATSYWNNFETGAYEIYDEAAGGQWSRPPAFQSGAAGLISTVDDYLAFAQMLLNEGKHGNQRILSRPSVLAMTTDQLTPDQRATAGMILGENRGWGFGVSMVLQRDDVSASPGRYGWDGGLGTSWYNDPAEDLTAILMTQRMDSFEHAHLRPDFWTSVYQAIDD